MPIIKAMTPKFTDQQKSAIKAYVLADPVLGILDPSSDAINKVVDALNSAISPFFYVYQSSLSLDVVTSLDSFNWTLVDNLTVGKARIFEWMFNNSSKSINPAKPNIRAGIGACWTGSAPLTAVGTAILGICYRQANVMEKLFATGTGTTVAPATMTFEGTVNYNDILTIMSW